MWEIGSSIPGRVKPMTYKTDACHFIAWCSAVLRGQGMDWLTQWENNVTEQDIELWCQKVDFPVFAVL